MFEKYGSISIENQSVDIDKLSTEEIRKYLEIVNGKEKQLIVEQNEYLSKLIG